MKNQPIISIQNVSKWFGQVIAINDISLLITEGIVGLLGPNGAGKSTLIKLLTGQLKPSRGTVKIFDQPIWNNPELNREIGYCMEGDRFYESMSGFEFVDFLSQLHGYDKTESIQRTLRALETVDLIDQKDKKIAAYSKGMRQRIKFAQALIHDAKLLFLDEPLNGMDPIGRRQTIRLIRELGDRGVSVLVSSHILHEIEAITQSILLINHGRILAEGNISEIRALIDEHPHKVFISCDRPRDLAAICVDFENVASVKFEAEKSVVIETFKPDQFYDSLPEIVVMNKIAIDQIYSPDDNLQAVFKYLVS